jgi:hypothetical protein
MGVLYRDAGFSDRDASFSTVMRPIVENSPVAQAHDADLRPQEKPANTGWIERITPPSTPWSPGRADGRARSDRLVDHPRLRCQRPFRNPQKTRPDRREGSAIGPFKAGLRIARDIGKRQKAQISRQPTQPRELSRQIAQLMRPYLFGNPRHRQRQFAQGPSDHLFGNRRTKVAVDGRDRLDILTHDLSRSQRGNVPHHIHPSFFTPRDQPAPA